MVCGCASGHGHRGHWRFTRLVWVLSLVLAGCAAGEGARPLDPLSAVVHFYQGPLDHLSMVRRGTTAMYPASSDYALEAIEKHGALMGWFMTCDRLIRSGRDELRVSPWIAFGERKFSYDPVGANDFWWAGGVIPEALPSGAHRP